MFDFKVISEGIVCAGYTVHYPALQNRMFCSSTVAKDNHLQSVRIFVRIYKKQNFFDR